MTVQAGRKVRCYTEHWSYINAEHVQSVLTINRNIPWIYGPKENLQEYLIILSPDYATPFPGHSGVDEQLVPLMDFST